MRRYRIRQLLSLVWQIGQRDGFPGAVRLETILNRLADKREGPFAGFDFFPPVTELRERFVSWGEADKVSARHRLEGRVPQANVR